MLLVDPSGRLTILEYGFWPVPVDLSADVPMSLPPRGLAPEQLLGDGPPDDRYSLGLVLLHLLYGHLPGAVKKRSDERKRLGDAEYHRQSMRAVVSACPTELSSAAGELLESLLARFPEDRPPTETLAAQLRARAQECGGPSVEEWSRELEVALPEAVTDPAFSGERPLQVVGLFQPEGRGAPGRQGVSSTSTN